MNSVVTRETQNFHHGKKVSPAIRPNPLDLLLALDRMVVEASMQLFNINPRDRLRMRRQNRRLHAVVRQEFPGLLQARARG